MGNRESALRPIRGDKNSASEIVARRQLVLRYYLRGMGPEEIARVPGISASQATIYRDLEELKIYLAQKIDAEQLWPIRRAVALREELQREAWRIYHLPPRKHIVGRGEEQREVEEDPTFRQLSALNTIAKFADSLDRLAFGAKIQLQHATPEAQTFTDEYVKRLPEDEQVALSKAITYLEQSKSESGSQ